MRKSQEGMDLIHIYNNPKGEACRRLLDYAVKHASTFVLADRHQLAKEDSYDDVLLKLQPYLIKQVKTNRALMRQEQLSIAYSAKDWVCFYECNAASVAILQAAADSLLDWQHPRLPEDLCFLDHEEKDWLINIAHEGIMKLKVKATDHLLWMLL